MRALAEIDIKKVDEIIDGYEGEDGILIQLLLDLQSEFNWIPKEVIAHISERMGIPKSQIYRIATFYKAMSLAPVGRHVIQVCMGTGCYVKGGQRILDTFKNEHGLEPEGITPDGRFSLETVRCLGCCGLSPVIAIDGDVHRKVKPSKLNDILSFYP